jgi:type IV secretory pathway VirB10-like protein
VPQLSTLQKQEADAPPAPSLERRERFNDAGETSQPPRAAAPAPPPSPPPPAAPEAPKSLQETATVTGESPARADERQNAASARQQGLRGAIAGAAAVRDSSTLVIAAPTGARWRRNGAVVEFAPGADAPFTAVTLPVAAGAINAGASPGGTVCWLAGNGGVVLVSVDGSRFARANAPAPINLVAIAAADARTATVTAADGRRFRTTDAGVNWSPLP